jgi:hypothetical protein
LITVIEQKVRKDAGTSPWDAPLYTFTARLGSLAFRVSYLVWTERKRRQHVVRYWLTDDDEEGTVEAGLTAAHQLMLWALVVGDVCVPGEAVG